MAAVEQLAAAYGVDAVLEPSEFVDARSELLNGFQRVIQWMLLFTLLQALVGVVNTLLLSVGERRREFGLLRATGASRRQILRLVLVEGLSFAAVGTALARSAVGVGGGDPGRASSTSSASRTIDVPSGCCWSPPSAAMLAGCRRGRGPGSVGRRPFPRSRRSPTPEVDRGSRRRSATAAVQGRRRHRTPSCRPPAAPPASVAGGTAAAVPGDRVGAPAVPRRGVRITAGTDVPVRHARAVAARSRSDAVRVGDRCSRDPPTTVPIADVCSHGSSALPPLDHAPVCNT